MIGLTWAIPGILAIIAAGWAAATAETALSVISRARVEEMARDGRPGAAGLLAVVDHRARHVNVLVLLRTLAEVAATVLTALVVDGFLESGAWAVTAAIVAMSLVTFLILGVLARTLGRRTPYTVGLAAAGPVRLAAVVLGPVEKALIAIGNVLTPGGGFRDGPFSGEVELREMVDIAQERGIVEVDERRMIQSVFDLGSTTARAVMVPRPEMVWIERDKTARQAATLCSRSGYSRIPVIGEDADDVLGVVYLKDLAKLAYRADADPSEATVRDIMRPPVFVPDSTPLDDLLDDMQRTRNHLAILIDEYGGVAGLISLEDILEEIVGEIADEYDVGERAPVEELPGGGFRVLTRLGLDELVELHEERRGIRVEFDGEVLDEVDTVGGLLAYELGRVPLPGSEVEVAGLHLTAAGGADRRGRMRVDAAVVEVVPGAFDDDGNPSDGDDGDGTADRDVRRDRGGEGEERR